MTLILRQYIINMVLRKKPTAWKDGRLAFKKIQLISVTYEVFLHFDVAVPEAY